MGIFPSGYHSTGVSMNRVASWVKGRASPFGNRAADVGNAPVILAIFAAIFFTLHLALCWPGIMTWDSEEQFAQALEGRYNNWHPPVMAALWRLLHPLGPFGAPLLVLHLAFYWGALFVIAVTLAWVGRRLWAYAVLGSGLLPGLLLLSAFIHKDVGMTTALLAAFAIVFAFRGRGLPLPWPATIAALILLTYAVLVRTNAVFAAGPMLAYIVAPRRAAAPIRLALVSVVVAILAIPASNVINARVFHAANFRPMRSLVVFDTTAIASRAQDPSVFGRARNPSLAIIYRCYTPRLWDPIFARPACKQAIDSDWVAGATWMHAIIRHPLAYGAHRVAHWNEAMALWSPVERWTWGDNPAIRVEPARFDPEIKEALHRVGNFPLFSPAIAFVAMLAIILAVVRFRQHVIAGPTQAAYFLAVSSCFYAGSFLLVGVANMYRYQQLTISGAAVSLLLYAAGAVDRPVEQNKAAFRWIAVAAAVVAVVVITARLILPAGPVM